MSSKTLFRLSLMLFVVIGSSQQLRAQQQVKNLNVPDLEVSNAEISDLDLADSAVIEKTKAVHVEKTQAALDALGGKWIVRAISRDGKKNPAQVGQEKGDVITIKKSGDRFVLG